MKLFPNNMVFKFPTHKVSILKYIILVLLPVTVFADGLFNAVLVNNISYVSNLIDKNINIKITNGFGMNVLHVVQDRNMAELLLLQGVDPDAENNVGSTPFQWAVSGENFRTALFFLEYGADINHQDHQGNTALHYAATGSPEMIALLLRAGANINIKNNMGYTPLQTALQEGNSANAIYLSSSAVKAVIAENKVIKPALAIASENSERQVLQANVPPEIVAVFSEDYATAKNLITKASDVNGIKDEQGNTLLHWAVIKKNRPLIRLLLFKNADISIANKDSITVADILKNIDDKNLVAYINNLSKEQKNTIR